MGEGDQLLTPEVILLILLLLITLGMWLQLALAGKTVLTPHAPRGTLP